MKRTLKLVIIETVFLLFAGMATIAAIIQYICWALCLMLADIHKSCDAFITWLAARGAIISNAIKEW